MSPKNILIVDKDSASRGYLAKTLKLMQHTVQETALGKEGLILAWGSRPDLIIVDPALNDLPGEEMLRKLRKDQRSEKVPAIALSSDANPARKAACLDAGFNQYLLKSMDAIPTLLELVHGFLDDPRNGAENKSRGLLIVFLSSKGGIGTSSLCANIAMSIAASQKDSRVAVMDCVLPIGSIAPIVGYEGEKNLVTVCAMEPGQPSATDLLNNLPLLSSWQFHLLAGSPNPQSANKLQSGRIESVTRSLQASYEFVLVDIGRGLSRITLPLIKRADLIVLVLASDMNTVALTQIVWEYLDKQGVPPVRIFPVLNRAVGLEGLTKPQIEEKLHIKISAAVPYMGENFVSANNQHVPMAVKFPTNTAAMILQEAATGIVSQAQKIREGFSG